MPTTKSYWVYLMGNKTRSVLYIGVTNDLERRVAEHKAHVLPGFTDRYNATDLLYAEECPRIDDAIAREKQLKGWSRKKKIALISSTNPAWKDLAADWTA